MSSENDDNQGVVFGILGAAVVLAIALAVGFGLGKKGPKAVPAALPVAVVATEVTDGARVLVEDGVVKFYFASAAQSWHRVPMTPWRICLPQQLRVSLWW